MPIKFRKELVSHERYEAAGVFDVNNNGHLDIVSGAYWYEGPEFRQRYFIGEVQQINEYYDDFSTIALDVNGSGYLDYVTGAWWGGTLRWRENPGAEGGEWRDHTIAECGSIEATCAWDLDGNGRTEVVPNTPGGPLAVYRLSADDEGNPTGQFTAHLVYGQKQGHGLGCGDINGNGRPDFVMAHGWLEAPSDPWSGEWKYHSDFDLGSASIPVLVVDVNGDGLNDLIVGQAHQYGLDWWEQQKDDSGRRSWTRHPIDPHNSQYHDLRWVDIDGDGAGELVTGKRYRAHNGRDPGAADYVGIYYFKWDGESFSKQVIDYGPPGGGKGCGICFVVADIRGSGRMDVVAPGKDGLWVYYNEGL